MPCVRSRNIAFFFNMVQRESTVSPAREGFPPQVIRALSLMTHEPSVPYLDYVKALKADPLARRVKLADLRHNSDLARLDAVDEKALERVQKYARAIEILEA